MQTPWLDFSVPGEAKNKTVVNDNGHLFSNLTYERQIDVSRLTI